MVNRRAAVSAIAVLVILHRVSLPAICQPDSDFDESDQQDCLYEGKDACNRADLLGCVWCDLPRRCYSATRSLQLGAFCNSPLRKESVLTAICEIVASEAECFSKEECRWCRSRELDDGCFSAGEAHRLPLEIFSCPDNTPIHLPASSRNSLS